MAEKMTAVWLIILTIIVCASVPAVMILLTSPHPKAQLVYGLEQLHSLSNAWPNSF